MIEMTTISGNSSAPLRKPYSWCSCCNVDMGYRSIVTETSGSGPETSAAVEFKNRGEHVSLLGWAHVRIERQPNDQLVDTLRNRTESDAAAEFNAFRRQMQRRVVRHGLDAVQAQVREQAVAKGNVRHYEVEHVKARRSVRQHYRQRHTEVRRPPLQAIRIALPHLPAPALDPLGLLELGSEHRGKKF